MSDVFNINQPKPYVEKNFTFRYAGGFSTIWNKRYSDAQKIVDFDVLRYCSPLVPFKTGALIGSGIINTIIGTGLVVYFTPYAARLYYNPQYNFNGAPLRGAYWFERMKAKDKEKIRRNAGLAFQ